MDRGYDLWQYEELVVPRLPSFPRRLRYLLPVIERFSAIPQGELDESTDTSELEQVLRQRVLGRPVRQAERLLHGDRGALQQWLSHKGNENHPGHFIYGWMLTPDLAKFLLSKDDEPQEDPAPYGVVRCEVPTGWKGE